MARYAVFFVTTMLAALVFAPALFAQARVDALGDPLPEGAITRLGTTRMRHFHLPDRYCWGLGCIAWSPDGKMIATTSYAEGPVGVEAKLWEASTGKQLSLLENTKRYGPNFVRFTPDNKMLAAAAGDKIVLWDTATGRELGQLVGHKADIDALGFQDGGKTAVSVSRDGAVRWWDVARRKTLREWQLLANDPKKTDKGDPILLRGTCHARFSADGNTLAVAKWWTTELKKPRGANLAIVYDLKTRKEIWRQEDEVDIYRFAFAPDGKRLAVSWRSLVRLKETTTGRQLAVAGFDYPSGMDFSPDGKTLALCMNGKVAFWSPGEKTPPREVEVPIHGSGYNIFDTDPAFAPDGKRLAIDRRLTFQVLDVVTGKPVVHWPSYDEGFRRRSRLAFSADGRSLFEPDKAISIDTATWRQRAASEDPLRKRRFASRQSVSVDRTLCVARDGHHPDTLFDTRTGRVVARFKAPAHRGVYHDGFFSPRANLYVMQDRSCDEKEVDTLFAIPSGKRLCQLSFEPQVQGYEGTRSWSFSADGSRVAFFVLRTATIHVHDTATGKLLWQARRLDTSSFALSPNGNMLAVWTQGFRKVQIVDLRTGKHHRWLVLKQKAKKRDHACLAWSPDNLMLAVGGLGDSIRLWEVASGEVRREFRGHQAQATCLAFSCDGQLLASGSEDTTLLIWKTRPEKKRRDRPKGEP